MNEHIAKIRQMVESGIPFENAYFNAWKEMRDEEGYVRKTNEKIVKKTQVGPKIKLIGKAEPINRMMKMNIPEDQIAEILQLKISRLRKIVAKFELPQDG